MGQSLASAEWRADAGHASTFSCVAEWSVLLSKRFLLCSVVWLVAPKGTADLRNLQANIISLQYVQRPATFDLYGVR